MEQTPSNRPVRPENLAAALKRNMARRKGVSRQPSVVSGDGTGVAPASVLSGPEGAIAPARTGSETA